MPSCVIPTCQNASGLSKKKQGISFHKFPCDELRKEMWTKIVRKTRLNQMWKPSTVSVICSEHFNKEDIYYTDKGLKRLRVGAIPSKNMVCISASGSIIKEKMSDDITSRVVLTEPSTTGPMTDINDMKMNIEKCSSDTPKILQLKNDLQRITDYCKKYTRKIKTLQKKNKLLVNKNKIFKKCLYNLKNNKCDTLLIKKNFSIKDLQSITKDSLEKENPQT